MAFEYSVHNETRSKFIARYYDVNKCGYLSEHELRAMLKDIHQSKSDKEINSKLVQMLAGLQTEPDPNKPGKVRVLLRKLIDGIGAHTMRGTSTLCSLNQPIFVAITNVIFARMKLQAIKEEYANVLEKPYVGICLGCKASAMPHRTLYPVLNQTRCVQVASPAYIIGDIHGNLSDLLSLEKAYPNILTIKQCTDRALGNSA